MIEAAGIALSCEERGDGQPAVVLVHGIATDRTVWSDVALESRTIVYDRRAYGESGAPEPYGGTTVGEQGDDLEILIRETQAAPAVLCGQDFGALVCLDVMVRFPELTRGAVLIEPPMLWLSPHGSETMSELRDKLEGGNAVEAYLGDATSTLGPQRVAAARDALRGFAADLGAIASFAAGRRELRSIEQPVVVVSGRDPVYEDVARRLVDLLPQGELLELGSGRFPQLERPKEVAAAIRRIASA